MSMSGMTVEKMHEIRGIRERQFAQSDLAIGSVAEQAGINLTTLNSDGSVKSEISAGHQTPPPAPAPVDPDAQPAETPAARDERRENAAS